MWPLVIAHRTCPLDAPENSLAGLRVAVEQSADYVEIDVRATSDGVAVLSHDAIPTRTMRWPLPIRRTPYPWLRRWTDRWGDEVPTLAAAVEALEQPSGLAVDVKDPGAMPVVVDTIEAAGAAGRVLLWCREAHAVRLAAQRLPGVTTALLRDTTDEVSTLSYLDDARDAGAAAVSLHQRATTERTVAAGQDRGLAVYSWVVDAREHRRVIESGVDGVVTDWPALAREIIAGGPTS